MELLKMLGIYEPRNREIAVMLGCAEGTVKNLLFRGVRKMRKSLHAYFKDEVDVLS